MLFGKVKPTVTPEDKDWIEEAFLWFEGEYTRDYLKNVTFIEPTKEFFPINFDGTEKNAEDLTKMVCDYMDIKGVDIDLYYFIDKPVELADGIITTQNETGFRQENKSTLGTFSAKSHNRYSVGIESGLLKNPTNLIATIAHELSHLILLGEGRLKENNEELTDLNCIALGFGIFTCNSIFTFDQWQGTSNQGWQTQKNGYIPEEVATYALALLTQYQGKADDSWTSFLNPTPRKMFTKNMRYLSATTDEIRFR
jgi:hypothetical protein